MEETMQTMEYECRHPGTGERDGDVKDVFSCLPLPCGVCNTLRRFRAPALQISYHMNGHIIPDLDAEKGSCRPRESHQSGEGPTASEPSVPSQDNGASSACPGNHKTDHGCMTIRLFDLALLAAGMAMISCMKKLF